MLIQVSFLGLCYFCRCDATESALEESLNVFCSDVNIFTTDFIFVSIGCSYISSFGFSVFHLVCKEHHQQRNSYLACVLELGTYISTYFHLIMYLCSLSCTCLPLYVRASLFVHCICTILRNLAYPKIDWSVVK